MNQGHTWFVGQYRGLDMFLNSCQLRCGLFTDIECAKSYAKMAESARTLASQQVSRCCC